LRGKQLEDRVDPVEVKFSCYDNDYVYGEYAKEVESHATAELERKW
ncbi:hypothetical protein L195_g032877, partial [Trifolium pratense]